MASDRPSYTPSPGLLFELAHVPEVDLAAALGRERLSRLVHEVQPRAHRRLRLLVLALGLAAALLATLAILGRI
jgi:hypothetical protein